MKDRPDPLQYEGKRILKYVPVQLCNYKLFHEPLEFCLSLTGVSSSIHLKQKLQMRCEKWEVKHFIVLLFGRTGLPHPSKVHSQCSFAFYSNSQTLKCLINLVFWFKCFLLILLRWVIKRVGKTQLKYERKNICFRDLYFALNWGFVDSYQLSYKYLVPRENQTLQSQVNNNKIYQPQGGDLKYNYSRLVVVI